MPIPDRRRVTDIDALRTLANPVRYRLLGHLMAVGPQTASQCAAVVGETASNCSYHLRELARFGLVERADDVPLDGRERPWRSAATGWEFRPADDARDEPVARAANRRLAHAAIDEEARLAHEAADRLDEQDDAWLAATVGSTYNLRLTASEMAELGDRLDVLIRPYIALTRDDAPPGAEPVHVALRAYRRPLP